MLSKKGQARAPLLPLSARCLRSLILTLTRTRAPTPTLAPILTQTLTPTLTPNLPLPRIPTLPVTTRPLLLHPPPPLPPHQAYTARFKKMMAVLGEAFDAKHLTNTVTGAPRSLEFRVQVRLGLGFA